MRFLQSLFQRCGINKIKLKYCFEILLILKMKKSSSYSYIPVKKINTKTFDLKTRPSKKNSIQTANNTRISTSKSLANSYVSAGSKRRPGNGINLSNNSYYNDRKKIYQQKSRVLSEKSMRYQSREISFSERRKLNESNIEKVLEKRSKSYQSISAAEHPPLTYANRIKVKERMTKLNEKKYSQLLNAGKDINLESKLLNKIIVEKREKSSQSSKWSSPFRNTETFKARFQGKDIVTKKFQGFITNSSTNQLKVLNLDRLFRKKNGLLGNILPLPSIKLDSAQGRSNMINTIKKKDTIHHVIEQFNKLLHINKIKKTKPKIGIRGHNFLRTPTLQELMGIKVHRLKSQYETQKSTILQQSEEEIPEEIFIEYSEFYRRHMKKNIHLTRRLISGLKQEGKFNLGAMVRFYAIFINRVGSFEEKIKFLLFFFIPFGQQKIQLDVLKLILEIMCQELPQIGNLAGQNQSFLTRQEKSIIFLQALNKVLFADLKEFVSSESEKKGRDEGILIDREILGIILERNEDAVDLLIKLLMIE